MPRSRWRFRATAGRCSNTSSPTPAGLSTRGAASWIKTARARPPMVAESTTFASATRTSGSFEIGEELLLLHAFLVEFPSGSIREFGINALPNVVRQVGPIPRQKEPGWLPVASHEENLMRAHHLARPITKVSKCNNLHVVTSVATILPRNDSRCHS